MGQYIVLHMEKRREISPVLERHIFRLEIRYVDGVRTETVWTPDNADPEKSNLNEELISLKSKTPEGKDITLTINQAIRKRLDEAGIKKVRKDQNTAIEIILTGSPETMNNLSEEELKNWVEESMEWAGKQWDKKNIVSAVLHRDEKTPHIHIILVPLVTGQSRRTVAKTKQLKKSGISKNSYNIDHKKLRLSANEVYTLSRLYDYHTSYAKKVGKKFGLQRGIQAEAGSKKKHQTSEEYNRQLERDRREQQKLIDTLKSDYSEKEKNLEQINADIEIAQGALNIADQERITAEARKDQAEIDAATKEAQVKELDKKVSFLDGEITNKTTELKSLETQVQTQQVVVTKNKTTIDEQIENWKIRKEKIENQKETLKNQQTTIDANIKTINDQDDQLRYNEEQLKIYREMGTTIENRQEQLRALSSHGLQKLIADIPNMIKKEVQDIVSKIWIGELVSFEEFDDEVSGEPQKFVRIHMQNGSTKYEFEVQESDGHVWKDDKWCTYRDSTQEVYMPELAAYFRQELLPETKEFVRSMYKVEAPAKTVQQEQEEEVVWTCNIGINDCRIIRKPDGVCYLQKQEWDTSKVNTEGMYYVSKWISTKAFKSFSVLNQDANYAYLQIQHANGEIEYVNQYGVNLSIRNQRSLGTSGMSGPS